MTSTGMDRGSWDDERVARELESWFASRAFERWPTYRTFVAEGHKRLYGAVLERGGPQRWAAELGVPCIPHRSGGGLSSDDVHDALRHLLRAHRPARFPTLAWLKRYGPPGLAAAIVRTGGAPHWAGMLHIQQEQLVRALQHGHEAGVDVLYDGEKIVARRPAAQPVPTSARELAASTHAMLPRVSLPALIIDVAHVTPSIPLAARGLIAR